MSATHDERADAYLHGLLTPAEKIEFERNLAEDAALQAALDMARRRLALLEAALPPAESSEPLVRAALARIDRHTQSRRRWRRRVYAMMLAPLAACTLIIALFNTHYTNLAASPANLEVYGQTTLISGSDGALRVRLTDKHTKAPLAGVPVEVTLGEPGSANFVSLATVTTDALGNGQPSFRLPDWADGFYPLRVVASTKSPEVLTRPVQLRRSAKLLLTSDKPVYQPGQMIHLRSLTLLRPHLKPAADVEAIFTINDPRNNVIFRAPMRTSRFGIAAADCRLADELIEGTYRIHCKVGDTDSSLTVNVRKYVLPKVRLALETERPWYQPGQEVQGTLRANYYHGEPAVDAEWTLEAQHGPTLLAKLSGRTDANGEATFSFRLPDHVSGEFTLAAQVRDRAGQEQTRGLRLQADRQPFRVTIIPENGQLVSDLANTVFVFTATPDGAPISVSGTATIGRDVHRIATGELGVAAFSITPGPAAVTVSLDLMDAKSNRHIETKQVPLGDTAADFLIRTDKAVYTSGDTMRLTASATGNGPVFLDILKDDQTVRSEIIDVQNGRGELVLDLPADLFGTLQLFSYRFDAQSRIVRKLRTLFVRAARELRIGLKPDKAEYRPGATGRLDFALTDETGRPIAGALSLAMVDEAVFDVRQQLPGLERTFYLLEQKLLQPRATIYPWTPDAEFRAAPQQRELFEQAVFAGTSQVVTLSVTPHTLTAETYPAKAIDTTRLKYRGLEAVNNGWILLGLFCVLAISTAVWMNFRLHSAMTLHAIGGIILITIVLVFLSTMRVRYSSEIAGSRNMEWDAAREPMPGGMLAPRSMEPTRPKVGPPGVGGPAMVRVRVRDRFPETLLWKPELITDDAGRASLDLEFADSITTWRLSASAVSSDGRLGALRSGIRVFQPFFVDLNLPRTLTRGDEIDVPAVVSNFEDKPQTVELTLEKADWFDLLGADALKLEMKAREVRSVAFRIKVKMVGKHELKVIAKSPALGDAIRREIEVVPDGRRVERITNGTLSQPARITLDLPADAIEGSGKAIVRIYPSSFSQLVEGLEGLFRLPTGCFEQTSSALYPNVMALNYLRQIDKRSPEIEATALKYIHAGYQRLLTFEVPGGGFDWYGRPPANVALTAYGLAEFRDMARVFDVDPQLIERTRRWLLAKRNFDGSWDDDRRYVREEAPLRRLRATAYVAAVVYDGRDPAEAKPTRDYLLRYPPDTIISSYLLALVCNALLAIDPKDESVRPYMNRLLSLKQSSPDGTKTWWSLGGDSTTFYGSGRCGDVEATALAVLALQRAEREPPLVRSTLPWIVEQRRVGHWGSTQATVLALKALLHGTKPDTGPRRIDVALNGQMVKILDIPPDQGEVMQQIDLSDRLKPGRQELTLADRGGSGFQVDFRYHVPGAKPLEEPEPLTIDLKYDRETLTAADILNVAATVTNRQVRAAPMVMLDLPVPPGFAVDNESFDALVNAGTIARYQVTPLQVIVYLRGLNPAEPLTLKYRLRPGEPANLAVPAARVYEYYNPDREGRSAATRLIVTPGK